MTKMELREIINEVMLDRNIDSIRDALMTVMEKAESSESFTDKGLIKIELRGSNELTCVYPWFDGAKYVVIDPLAKTDTGLYGEYWYAGE